MCFNKKEILSQHSGFWATNMLKSRFKPDLSVKPFRYNQLVPNGCRRIPLRNNGAQLKSGTVEFKGCSNGFGKLTRLTFDWRLIWWCPDQTGSCQIPPLRWVFLQDFNCRLNVLELSFDNDVDFADVFCFVERIHVRFFWGNYLPISKFYRLFTNLKILQKSQFCSHFNLKSVGNHLMAPTF